MIPETGLATVAFAGCLQRLQQIASSACRFRDGGLCESIAQFPLNGQECSCIVPRKIARVDFRDGSLIQIIHVFKIRLQLTNNDIDLSFGFSCHVQLITVIFLSDISMLRRCVLQGFDFARLCRLKLRLTSSASKATNSSMCSCAG